MSEKGFVQVTDPDRYLDQDMSKTNVLPFAYPVMVKVIGQPFRRRAKNYPDDSKKTNVCWMVESADRPGSLLAVWDYSNKYVHDLNSIHSFSCWTEDEELFNRVCTACNGVLFGGEV